MKKRGMGLFIAMGGIALVLIIASIFLIVSGGYKAKLVLVNDGFFVGDQVHDCLFETDENAIVTSLPAIGASQSDILYEKSGQYFIGNDYTPVSLNFPYVINNASAVMFTSGIDKLITGTFEYVDSYENLYMSGGVTFNADMERAYREDFILVDTGNGIYMNAEKLSVGGALTTAAEIPANSFIRFLDNEIVYYYYENDALLFARIAPVSRTASVSIGGYNYTYIEFLEKLGLYSERKTKEKISPTPTPAPERDAENETATEERKQYNFSDPNYVPADEAESDAEGGIIGVSTSTNKGNPSGTADADPSDEGERDDEGGREMITPDPGERPTRAPRPTSVPSIPEPAGDPLPAEEQPDLPTATPRPTATPLPTPTLMPIIQTAGGGDPAVPAEPAAPAPPASAAEPVAAKAPSAHIPVQYIGSPDRPVYFEEWKKPIVYLGDITTGTYTIFLNNFHIENSQFLYKRYGVQFAVKEGTDKDGKLVYTKNVMGSGALRLGQPFKPNTKYTLEVILSYINAFGEIVDETVMEFGDVVVETKGRDFLDGLDLSYTKGKKASNSFILNDVGIGIAVDNPAANFIEAVEYISRVEFDVTNEEDANDTRIVTLSNTELNKLRKGELFNFESSRVFRSNSNYKYVIRVYDRTGEALFLLDANGNRITELPGKFKTCTEFPRVTFRVQNNKIYDYTVAMRLFNTGNAGMKNVRYRVLDMDDNVVLTTTQYLTTVTGGAIEYSAKEQLDEHPLTTQIEGLYDPDAGSKGVDPNRLVEVVTKFSDLADQAVYRLQVLADCDVYAYDESDYEDGRVPDEDKWLVDTVIGETKFTTANIASLGNFFIENVIPVTDENLAEGQLYMNLRLDSRTNETLIDLIDEFGISFWKNEKDEDGKETGNYVLDDTAKISYVICTAGDDSEYMDIKSVIDGTRPADLERWEAAATLAGQNAYDRTLEENYDINLAIAKGDYSVTVLDDEGNETVYGYDYFYTLAFNAQNTINTGDLTADSEEYAELEKIIDNFVQIKNNVETTALTMTREEAEDARKKAYRAKYLSESGMDPETAGDLDTGYVTGKLVIGEDIIGELKAKNNNPDPASGSSITYKYEKELRIAVTGLATNTTYEIRCSAVATVGTSGAPTSVRTALTRPSFKTYRKRAIIKMDAYYASSTFISLFGVSIDDPDEAITEYPVELTVTNKTGGLMAVRTFNGPGDRFEELRFSNLATEQEYTLRFLAKGYNRAWSKASSEINKEIFVNDLDETLKLITHESIKAEISIKGINDAYDLAPEVRVYPSKNRTAADGPITGKYASSLDGEFSYTLGKNGLGDGNYYVAGGGQTYYVYKARYEIKVDLGNESYNVIEPAIYPTRNRFTRYQLFEDINCTKPLSDVNDPNASVMVTAKDANTNAALSRAYWTSNYIRLNKYLTGKQTLYLVATALNIENPLGGKSTANSGVYMFCGVSFHRFGDRAYTANINAVLKDDYGQLGSDGVSKYYVRVYEKEGEATSGSEGYRLISERLHEWRELAKNEAREHEEDNCLLEMYEYDKYADGGRGPGLGSKTFVGGSKQIDTNFGVRVSTGKYYRLELWIKINNYNIRVGTVNFTSERIIHSIDNVDDLLDAYCHPSDSYIVTADLVVNKANIFTTKQFDGVIDFNGHTLTHNSNDYLIHTFGAYGEIRNLVYEKGNGNYKNIRGIIYDNYGHLDNIIVNYKNKIETIDNPNRDSTNFRESQYVQGLIATTNEPTGVVENFCIDLQEDMWFYASDGVALSVYNNYGMLRNGYSCSTTGAEIRQVALLSDFEQLFTNKTTAKTQYTNSYYTGGLVRRNINGIIESVFGLVDMKLRNNDTNNLYRKGAAICGRNDGYVRNSFSAANVLTLRENNGDAYYEAKKGRSPAVQNFFEGNNVYGHSSNIYHYSDYDYGQCMTTNSKVTRGYDSVEIRKELLHDRNWYEALFESDDITRPGQWNYDYIMRGCYPQVVMSECMPAQPLIDLPMITQTSSDIIPLSAIVTEQNDNDAYATITFFNPNALIVNEVDILYLSTRVVQQWEEGRFYYVKIKISNPLRYYSTYDIRGFLCSTRSSSAVINKPLDAGKYLPINVEFYKMIRTVDDFASISSGLDENYRLANDIDFFGYDIRDYAVCTRDGNGVIQAFYDKDDNENCFVGKFEGRNHTLKNIDVGDVGFLFGKIASQLKDFNVENIHTADQSVYGAHLSTAKYMGIVATMRQGGGLDNVHVYGARFENITQFCGTLVARNFFENEITNCTVRDAVFVTGMPADNSTAASVGGLVGHNDLGVIIHNCFIDNFEIKAEQAGDVYGVGGIVGYTVNGIEIENVYAVRGKISTNYANAGGLVGSVQSMNDVSTSSKTNYYTEEYFIRNYYSDVEIVTMADNIGGVIGYTSKLSGWDYNYGVNFGRIIAKSSAVDDATLGPVVGFYTGTSNADKKGLRLGKQQYAYETYEINGNRFVPHDGTETETSRLAYFKTLSYSDLTNENTYGWEDALNRPVLAWRENFEIKATELQKGNMPKLYYSYTDEDGNKMLLPDQADFSLLPSEIEVESVTVGNTDLGTIDDIVELTVVLSHDASVKPIGFDFEGTKWDGDPIITTLYKEDGSVRGTRFFGRPVLRESQWAFARDKFFITAINYKKSEQDGVTAEQAIASDTAVAKKKIMYVDLKIKSRWLIIKTEAEWNQVMTEEKYGKMGYNIYIANDLDFSKETGTNASINAVAHNVVINNLIGRRGGENNTTIRDANGNYVYSDANTVTIKGIRLYEDDNNGNTSCFIEQATGMIAGINFEDCTVCQPYNSAKNGKISNKTALIGIVNGKIEHVAMRRINILGFASANMAPIGLIYNVSSDITLEDINVIQHKKNNSSYISTYSNRGGYTAFMGKFAGINGLTGNRIYVDAAGANMGGVVGNEVGGTYLWDINLKDVVAYNRTASSFVGGIVGNAKDRGTYQRAGKLHVDNVFVRGHSYVGGIAGRAFIGGWNSDGYRRVTGTTIAELATWFDKDTGTTNDSVRSWVKRGLVVSYAGESVGGAVGLGGAWKTTVEDSTVLGGSYTGGVVGRYAAVDCKAQNVYVSRWNEKVEGEKMTDSSFYDTWPSMYYRPGGGTVDYRQLVHDTFSASGNYKKSPGYGHTGEKTYLKDDTNYKNYQGYASSHDYEQAKGEGQYFVWKNYVTTNVASDPTRKQFWDEAVWGVTAWYRNFAAEERTHGRPGKTYTSYGAQLAEMQDSLTILYNTDGEAIKKLNSNPQIEFQYNATTYDTKNTTRYDYIGGVVGYAGGMRNLVAENCFVYAPRSLYVGGITGRSSVSDGNYTAFGGNYSLIVKGSTVIGGDEVGGAIGEYWRYKSQAIFVDDKTFVEARKFTTTGRTGTMVGGIAGRVYLGTTTVSDHPQISYVVSAATVVGKNQVGGIAGMYDLDFFSNESDVGWLMLGNVIVNDPEVSNIKNGGMLFGKKTGTGFPYSVAILDTSEVKVINNPVNTATNKLKDNNTVLGTQSTQNYLDSLTASGYDTKVTKVTSYGLLSSSVYTATLGWPDSAGLSSSNYTTKRFKYDMVSQGYLPSLTMAGAVQTNYNEGKKDFYPWERILINIPGYETNQGSGGSGSGGALIDLSGMPQATLYASGADMISVDFSKIDPAYTWTISIGGQVLSGEISEKTVSFTYDFVSDVTLVISGGEGETVYTSSGADLAHYIGAAGGSYYYITNEGIARGTGSTVLPTRYGQYMNIFGGKALERDGSIIDLETGAVTTAAERGTVLAERRTPEPLYEGQFGNYLIRTYADYSVTTDILTGQDTVRDGFLFYTNGSTLQSIRTGEKLRSDSVILWTESGNTYFAALGSDRRLNVLLDGAFRVPEGISTEGISEMSNFRDLRTPYCIVRYANGGLCAFNFVTGEILFEQSATRGLATGGGDASSGSRAISFSHAMELNDALKSGAYDLNGLVRTSPVSYSDDGIATELIEGDPVDGSVVSTGEPTGETTHGIKVEGYGTQTGDEAVDGEFVLNLEDIQEGAGSGLKADSVEEESETGEQPETSEEGGDAGEGPSGTALVPGDTAESNPAEGDLPLPGEESENHEGNTINGTNRDNGISSEKGEISVPEEGDPNVLISETVTATVNESVDPKLLESVEAEAGALIEDGSLSLDPITEVLGITEAEAAGKLYNAAAKIAGEDEGYSIAESITMAYRDIMMNPYDYIEVPVVRTLNKETDPDYLRDMEIIRYAAEGKQRIDASTLNFVPVYNPETGEYELFEADELLTGEEAQLKSIEERLAENGRFISTSRGYRTGVETEKPAGDYRGLIAVLVAILLAGGLTWTMIYKKRKEGSR